MEAQTAINIGIVMLVITGFTTIMVLDDEGIELEPTHYCESIRLKMYCARTTAQYCYPSLDTNRGSKKCSEGWKEIPELTNLVKISSSSSQNVIICDSNQCKQI